MREALNGRVEPTILDDFIIGGKTCNTRQRRPDALYHRIYTLENGIKVNVVVTHEIDENGGHPYNPSPCEAAKVFDEFIALKQLLGEDTRVFFLRYNPDRYDNRVLLEERIQAVADMTLRLFDGGEWQQYTPLVPHVFYYYYHSSCHHHIEYMQSKPDSCCVYVLPTAASSASSTDVFDMQKQALEETSSDTHATHSGSGHCD